MTSSPTSGPADAMNEPVLVREAGVQYVSGPSSEPIEAWVELMEAVEALCPRWPDRAPMADSHRFLL